MGNLKFTEKELVRLGCSDDEVKVVMAYQKKLPVLVENEGTEGFCVSARTLHKQLGVKTKFTDWFNKRKKAYKFIENNHFSTTSLKKEVANGGYKFIPEYMLTIFTAENLAMVERTEIGETVRHYFETMRNIVKKNKEWWEVRNQERKNYKPLCDALSECIHKQCGRYGDKYDFSREANILNVIATGCKATEIRAYLSVNKASELTRDSLEKDYNDKLGFLQEQDILLCGMSMGISDRIHMLIQMFDIKYPDAKPLQDYMTRQDLLNARQELIDGLS